MFPMVTGIRFLRKNPPQLRFAKSRPALVATNVVFKKMPIGMKYILAMLCSNPEATKAIIGK